MRVTSFANSHAFKPVSSSVVLGPTQRSPPPKTLDHHCFLRSQRALLRRRICQSSTFWALCCNDLTSAYLSDCLVQLLVTHRSSIVQLGTWNLEKREPLPEVNWSADDVFGPIIVECIDKTNPGLRILQIIRAEYQAKLGKPTGPCRTSSFYRLQTLLNPITFKSIWWRFRTNILYFKSSMIEPL